MFSVVAKKRSIKKCQIEFVRELKKCANETVKCKVGYKGGGVQVEAFYSAEFDFWFTSNIEHNRYWNVFGTGQPKQGRSNSIVVEINIPITGVNRRVGAVFAADDSGSGSILLLHRGNIGGGRAGISKTLFNKKMEGDFIIVEDNGRQSEFYLICPLNSDQFVSKVADFVRSIERIKGGGKDKVR